MPTILVSSEPKPEVSPEIVVGSSIALMDVISVRAVVEMEDEPPFAATSMIEPGCTDAPVYELSINIAVIFPGSPLKLFVGRKRRRLLLLR